MALTKHADNVKDLASSGFIIMSGVVIGQILGTINQILLARFLGPNDYGLFNIGFSIFSIAFVFSALGLRTGTSRFVSKYLKFGEDEKLSSVIRFSLIISLSSSIIITIGLFVLADFISINIFGEPNLKFIIQILALALPLKICTDILVAITRGFSITKYKVYSDSILSKFFRIVSFLIFIILGFELEGALFSFFISSILVFVFMFYAVNKNVHNITSSSKFDNQISKEMINYSLPLFLSAMLSLLVTQTSILLSAYYLEPYEVGIYSAAIGIAYMLKFFSSPFSFLALPKMSQLYFSNKFDEIKNLFQTVSRWRFQLAFPFLLIFVFFPSDILTLLFGKDYIEGSHILAIMAISVFLSITTGPTGALLQSVGHPKLVLIADLFGALSAIILNLYFIPLYGILGAAIATGIGLLSREIMALFFVFTKLKFHPYKSSIFKTAIFCTLFVVLISKTSDFLIMIVEENINDPFLSLYLSQIIFIISFLSFVLFSYIGYWNLGFISEDDKAILKSYSDKFMNFSLSSK